MMKAANRHASESWDLARQAGGIRLEMPAFAGMTGFA